MAQTKKIDQGRWLEFLSMFSNGNRGRRVALETADMAIGDQPPRTRLVFIARHGTVNIAAVEKALNGCKARSHRGADSLEAKGTTGAGPRQAQSGRSIRTTS